MRVHVLILLVSSWVIFGCDDSSKPVQDADAAEADAEAEATECRDDDDCNDGFECTEDYCHSGRCRYTAQDEMCDDGLQCNGQESCDQGVGCAAGEPLLCDDNIDCTDDECDSDQDRCIATPNHERCTGGYRCDPAQDGCVPT